MCQPRTKGQIKDNLRAILLILYYCQKLRCSVMEAIHCVYSGKENGMKEKIEHIIKKYVSCKTGHFSLGWMDLKDNTSYFYQKEQRMPAASVYKIFTLAGIAKKIDEGDLSWDSKIVLEEDYFSPGSGLLYEFHPGVNLTIRDYAHLMMIISDNTAADVLYHAVTPAYVTREILRPYGLNHTRYMTDCCGMVSDYYGLGRDQTMSRLSYVRQCNQRMRHSHVQYDCHAYDNVTAAGDMVHFLSLLYKGQCINDQCSRDILRIMAKCQTNTRIPFHLPADIAVAHKTGSMEHLVNDAGIVYTPRGDYILAMFYDGNTASAEERERDLKGHGGEALLADISGEIFSAYMN